MSNRNLAIRVFGPDAALAMAQAIAGKGKPPDWRGIFESVDAVQQCNKVVGAFKDKTTCYICGLPILAIKYTLHELRPECEHILPVAQARWYLDLFSRGSDVSSPLLKIEYAYAHRVCNQAKSDDSFIKPVEGDDAKIEYDVKMSKTILNTVKARASKVVSKFNEEGIMDKIVRMDVNARAEAIRTETLQQIIDQANSIARGTPGIAILARTATVVDTSRLSKEAAKAYEPYNDPAYVVKRTNFMNGLTTFCERVADLYASMLREPLFTKEELSDPWFADIELMKEAKRDGLLQDWYTILYKNVIVDKTSGMITTSENDPIFINAFEAGRIYVEFRLKMNAFKLLPYISSNTRTSLIKAKCWIIDFINQVHERRDTLFGSPIGKVPAKYLRTLGDFLKAAGIFIKDKEINTWILPPDIELCELSKKKDLTKLNRTDTEYGRILAEEAALPLPTDPYTEEESFAPEGGRRRRTLRKNRKSKTTRRRK